MTNVASRGFTMIAERFVTLAKYFLFKKLCSFEVHVLYRKKFHTRYVTLWKVKSKNLNL